MTITCSVVPVFSVNVKSSSTDAKIDALIAELETLKAQAKDGIVTHTELYQFMLQQQKLMNLHLSTMTDEDNEDILCDMSMNEDIDNDN